MFAACASEAVRSRVDSFLSLVARLLSSLGCSSRLLSSFLRLLGLVGGSSSSRIWRICAALEGWGGGCAAVAGCALQWRGSGCGGGVGGRVPTRTVGRPEAADAGGGEAAAHLPHVVPLSKCRRRQFKLESSCVSGATSSWRRRSLSPRRSTYAPPRRRLNMTDPRGSISVRSLKEIIDESHAIVFLRHPE